MPDEAVRGDTWTREELALHGQRDFPIALSDGVLEMGGSDGDRRGNRWPVESQPNDHREGRLLREHDGERFRYLGDVNLPDGSANPAFFNWSHL